MDITASKTKRQFPAVLLCTAAFLTLLLHADAGLAGAKSGVTVCLQTIFPALFPYFVLAGLLSRLGVPALLARRLTPLMSRLFRVSGAGATAFVLGLSGGYPLGAATIAALYRQGDITPAEGRRLLCFCNNSGPAFILGAVGTGLFGSTALGLLLYASHAAAAVLSGLLLARRGGAAPCIKRTAPAGALPFSRALPEAVSGAVLALGKICGFTVFFSVVRDVLFTLPLFRMLPLYLHQLCGLELQQLRALLTGFLELGSGVASLSGVPATAANAALAAFLLGWGGLSVHCQTAAVLSGTQIKTALHTAGRLLSGGISAGIVFFVLRLLSAL